MVELDPSSTATVTWTWATGSATGESPAINFGSPGTRAVEMTVTDGDEDRIADVRVFNLGYDHTEDAGLYMPTAADHAKQNVMALAGVNAMTGLVEFLASCSTLAGALDFTGMADLEFIELFHAHVTAVTLTGCSSLVRLDCEETQLTTLNLNPVRTTLRDLRAAHQRGGAGITFTALSGAMPLLYHYCVRDQTVVGHFPLSQMPGLTQLWNWNSGQSGALALNTSIREVRSYDNDYSSVTGIAGATQLEWVDLRGNDLDQADVTAIVDAIEALGTGGARRLDLDNLPAPTNTADVTALQSRGWTVVVEASGWAYSQLFGTARANLAALAADGFTGVAAPTVSVAGGDLIKSSSGSYQLVLQSTNVAPVADYEVEIVIPHAERNTAFSFLVLRYTGGTGVRVGWGGSPVFGTANDFNANDNAGTTDAGITWVGTGDHTVRVRAVGDQIQLYTDGVLAAHHTMTTNQAATNTSFGVGGGSATTYRSLTATQV